MSRHLLLTGLLCGLACADRPVTQEDVKAKQEDKDKKPATEEKAVKTGAVPVEGKDDGADKPTQPFVIGMQDPFKMLDTAGAQALDRAWKAARKKDYRKAREGFAAVVAAFPDKTAARFAELRMAVLEGDLAAAPALWKELLARDFPGYAGRLDKLPELAPLRKSPLWAQMTAITEEMRTAYAKGLDAGVFFVARIRPGQPPKWKDAGDGSRPKAKLDLGQEAYHFDPSEERIRRVSHTDGQVVAIHHDRDRGQLLLLTAAALEKGGGKIGFSAPAARLVSLATLDEVGPLPLPGAPSAVELCVSGKGEPIFTASSGEGELQAFTMDATGTALVATDERCGSSLATTVAKPHGVAQVKPAPEGVALSPDGLRLTGVDEEVPVRATAAISPRSLSWSPGKRRFVYTSGRDDDGCQAKVDGDIPEEQGLFVWDAERKRAQRLVKAPAAGIEAAWIDDDTLAYEVKKGALKKLTIHDFAAPGLPYVLTTPSGAGLHGLPILDCAEAEVHALVL